MTRRERTIVELLERYNEIVCTLNGPRGTRGDRQSDGLFSMSTYTPSVRELERLMVLMRERERPLWWHVSERYLRCRTVIRYELRAKLDKHNRVRRVKGKVVREARPVVVVVYSDRVQPAMVGRGVSWLADNWGLGWEPELAADYRFVA